MLASRLLLAALVASPAAAADVLPLAHGTYVDRDVPCADPPLAAMRSYDGRGLPDPHSHDCRARIVARDGANVVIENDCIGAGVGPAPRDTERLTLHLQSRTRFVDLTAGQDFRLCPARTLPPELRHRAVR